MATDEELLDTNIGPAGWFDEIPPLPASRTPPDTRVPVVNPPASRPLTSPGKRRVPLAVVEPQPDPRTLRMRARRTAGTARVARAGRWMRRHRAALALTAAGAVLVGTAALVVPQVQSPDHRSVAGGVPQSSVVSATRSAPGPWCAGRGPGVAVTGAGETRSATGLVAAFEHAFYDLRDAKAARALVAPDARFGDEATLAWGITQIPSGTHWCALVRESGTAGMVAVDLYEDRPTGELEIYNQLVSVTPAPAPATGVLISAITKRQDR